MLGKICNSWIFGFSGKSSFPKLGIFWTQTCSCLSPGASRAPGGRKPPHLWLVTMRFEERRNFRLLSEIIPGAPTHQKHGRHEARAKATQEDYGQTRSLQNKEACCTSWAPLSGFDKIRPIKHNLAYTGANLGWFRPIGVRARPCLGRVRPPSACVRPDIAGCDHTWLVSTKSRLSSATWTAFVYSSVGSDRNCFCFLRKSAHFRLVSATSGLDGC